MLCFDLVSFVDIALRVMPATGKFKPSQWKYTLALYIFVIKFVVRGIAELTSTGVVLLLVHLCIKYNTWREHEIEELQLQLESKVCAPGVDALAELAEHLQVEMKELGKLVLSKRIREELEQGLSEADDMKTLLVGLIAFVNGKPPLLEGDTKEDNIAKVKVEPLNSTKK